MEQQDLDFLTQHKIDLSLQLKTKKFDEDVAAMRRMIDDLRSEIFALRQKVESVSAAPSHRVSVPPPMPASVHSDDEEPIVRPEVQSPAPSIPESSPSAAYAAPEVKKESHPRQGNFTSADVDIQKFFNFSGKR